MPVSTFLTLKCELTIERAIRKLLLWLAIELAENINNIKKYFIEPTFLLEINLIKIYHEVRSICGTFLIFPDR